MEMKATEKEIDELGDYLKDRGFTQNSWADGCVYMLGYAYGDLCIHFESMANGRGFKCADAWFKYDLFDIRERRFASRVPLGRKTRCPDGNWIHKAMKYAALLDGAAHRFKDEISAVAKESAG